VIEAALIGALAGVFAGLLGIGGGALFVPALTLFAGLGQVEAEATSLLAIVPVAIVGAWRHRGYGNVRERDALLLGALSIAGAVGGVIVANAVPERALELLFAALTVYVAGRLAREALRAPAAPSGDTAAP
jgi:uncharacterized membrane protein YfcA